MLYFFNYTFRNRLSRINPEGVTIFHDFNAYAKSPSAPKYRSSAYMLRSMPSTSKEHDVTLYTRCVYKLDNGINTSHSGTADRLPKSHTSWQDRWCSDYDTLSSCLETARYLLRRSILQVFRASSSRATLGSERDVVSALHERKVRLTGLLSI
jgi:hypothetical protein